MKQETLGSGYYKIEYSREEMGRRYSLTHASLEALRADKLPQSVVEEIREGYQSAKHGRLSE